MKQQIAEEYLDQQFPKGDKRRGEAMVLMALARSVGDKIRQTQNRREAKKSGKEDLDQ